MAQPIYSVIVGTGSYIPELRVPNSQFHTRQFFDAKRDPIDTPGEKTVNKFQEITTIGERRYVTDDLMCSDIGFMAAEEALTSSGIDRESLDYIIVAHNFGDIRSDNLRTDLVPSIASRVKHKLRIENPYCIPYDLPFGCPGWVQGMIQADYFIKSGDAKRVLVIGAETLSRVCDPHDRDSMIYADGAGATIVEARPSDTPVGIITHLTRSDTYEHAYMLWQGESFNPDLPGNDLFLKMHGHRLYKYALRHVPEVVKMSLEKANVPISEVKKVLIHQANGKMDAAILTNLLRLYGEEADAESLMPMTVSWLGNSSVATVPTLLDLIWKGKMEEHSLDPGSYTVFASVGAGMNINSIVYQFPEA